MTMMLMQYNYYISSYSLRDYFPPFYLTVVCFNQYLQWGKAVYMPVAKY